jgi:hypothetical protein
MKEGNVVFYSLDECHVLRVNFKKILKRDKIFFKNKKIYNI